MKHLTALRQKLAKVAPFVVYELFGINNQLAVRPAADLPIVPLSVSCSPPDTTFILESGIVTDLIGRYSKTYQENLKKMQESNSSEAESNQFLQDSFEEVKEHATANPLEMIALITKVGKQFLISKALKGWYEADGYRDKFDIFFLSSKEECDLANAKAESENKDEMYIWIGMLDSDELFKIAANFQSMIMDTLDEDISTPVIANIPFLSDDKDGEVLEVPADKLAGFPRSTRHIIVEDVPR
jgi:hypothetical protein